MDAILLLQSKFQKVSEKWVAAQNIHLTLCFIGCVDESELKCIGETAEKLNGEKIHLILDVIGDFEKANILWLGLSGTSIPLNDLNRSLSVKLKSCGLKHNSLKFRPHITLAKKVNNNILKPKFEAIDWCSDFFYLMESVQVPHGVEYKVLKQYSLS